MKEELDFSLSKTIKDLLIMEPFYGLYLINIGKFWDDNANGINIKRNGINYILLINPTFWKEASEGLKIIALKHQLLHIAFFHTLRFHEFDDKKLAHIAMDIEVNQYLNKSDIPENWYTLKTFDVLNLPPKAGCKVYYELLKNALESSLIDKSLLKNNSGFGNMDDISKENIPEYEKSTIRQQIEYVIREVSENVDKNRGTIPGEFSTIIKNLYLEVEEKFPWKLYLRRFTGGSNKIYTKKLKRKYNKRFEEDPGIKVKKKRHILVAIDTSGSVSNKELEEFMNEINHIYKTGTEVTILQCDTKITSIEEYKPSIEIKIVGRGGTNFQNVIDYYNNNGKFTCLVYFTDGEAPPPTKANKRMLWVLSSTSRINEALIGPQIKLN